MLSRPIPWEPLKDALTRDGTTLKGYKPSQGPRNTIRTTVGTTGNHLGGVGNQCGAYAPLGPTQMAPALLALVPMAFSGSQKLTLAIVALVAVVVFGLWPIVRPKHYNQRQLKRLESNQRLKRELEKHD